MTEQERKALRMRFDALADEWAHETRFQSSSTEVAMHPAYQQIIGMGPEALPFILDRLGRQTEHWFWALGAISGEDPVDPDEAGKVEAMASAWLRWGRAKGLIPLRAATA
ncbi:MAG: hypothetical protein F4Y54_03835 [Dehalococcoidia bacterium]|nr:hypothetical protein [Dehalococcoidia bacterium]